MENNYFFQEIEIYIFLANWNDALIKLLCPNYVKLVVALE